MSSSVDSDAQSGEGVTDSCYYCKVGGSTCNLVLFTCPAGECAGFFRPYCLCPECLQSRACRYCGRSATPEDSVPYDSPPTSDSSIISWQHQVTPQHSGRPPLTHRGSDQLLIYCFVVEFKRNPRVFFEGLQNSTALAACQEALANAGHECELPGGAKLYVKPQHVEPVLKHLKTTRVRFQDGEQFEFEHLTARHLIVGEELRRALDQAIQSVPSRGRQRIMTKRRTDPIGVVPWVVKHTFFHVPVPSSLWSGPSSGAKTVSTTDAYPKCGENPRKKRHILQLPAAGSSQSLGGVDSQDSQQMNS